MSFIGNIAAAQTAKTLGKYNQDVSNQEAAYAKQQAVMREKVYNQIERPRFAKAQEAAYSDFFVSALRTGGEFREGTTPFFVGLKNKTNQMLDLALSDYNNKVTVNDMINQSLLIKARGRGERLKGDLTSRAHYAAAAGSLLTMGYRSNQAGRLVIT